MKNCSNCRFSASGHPKGLRCGQAYPEKFAKCIPPDFVEWESLEGEDLVKIKCPNCGVVYEVSPVEAKTVKCADCGAEYFQAIHNVENPEFVRAAAYRCRG